MSIGIPLIDSDHQVLIGLINDLHDGPEAGDELAAQGEHREFTERIHDVLARYRREADVAMTRDLLEFLRDWLNHHILIQDKAYARYTVMNPALANEVAAAFGPGLAEGVRHSLTGLG